MAGREAGSAGPVVVRRRVVSRRVIRRRRVIGLPVISVIVGRRRERHERRGDDRRGGADNGARYAKRPKQRKRRTRRIILRLGGRQRQSGEARPVGRDNLRDDLMRAEGKAGRRESGSNVPSRRKGGLDQRPQRREKVPMRKIILAGGVANADLAAWAHYAAAFQPNCGRIG